MTSGGNNFNDFHKKSNDQKSPTSPNLSQGGLHPPRGRVCIKATSGGGVSS